jgi:hypothetical protein
MRWCTQTTSLRVLIVIYYFDFFVFLLMLISLLDVLMKVEWLMMKTTARIVLIIETI